METISRHRSNALRYGVAVTVTIAAALLRLALSPLIGDTAVPFITFFPAVLFSAWYGGFRAGLVSILLSTVTADYFFVEPVHTFLIPRSIDQITLLIFIVVGLGMALLSHSQGQALERAEIAETAARLERQQLETTLASIGDAVIATDAKGQVSFINQVAESLTGWKRQEALGRPLESVFQIINEDTRLPVENPALKAMQQDRIFGLANHTVLIARDGTEIPVDDSGSPIRNSDGKILGAVLIFRDIAERRRAERALREQREWLRVTLSSIGDAVIATDVKGAVAFLNGVAASLTGWKEDEALGQPLETVFHVVNEQTRERVENPALRAIREGAIVGLANHTVLIRRDGSETPIDDAGSPIRDAEGKTIGSVLIFRDITQRRLVDKEREEAGRVARRLAAIVESSDDAIVAKDVDLCITSWNRAAERMFGYTAKEAIGQSIRLIVPEERGEEEDRVMSRIRRGEKVEHFETERRRKDGTIIGVSLTISPLYDSAGTVVGASNILRDVTERLQARRLQAELFERERTAREAAEAAELRLQLALDAGRMGTWEYSIPTGKVVWSPGLQQIHGYEPGTFPGTLEAFRDEIHADDRERVLAAISEAIGQRRDHHIEYRIVRKDGSVRWVEGRGRLFLDDDQNPDRMVGVCVDVTERRQAAEADSRARLAAEEANRTKDEFLAMLSHELRNPLSSILGWASVLRTGQMPLDRASHALEVIERNARLEAQLVESLLDLSRIGAGKLQLDSERVELAALLRSVMDSLRPAADAKGVDLQIWTQPDVVIVGDSGRLQQVFSNLLSNAVKFTPRAGHVQVRLSRIASNARIQVVDDGEGIDSDLLPHIFDRFRQAESAKGRSHGGLGLGLAIVRELIHAHGGTVVAESPGKGRGSTFTVTVPIPAVIPAHIEAASPRLVSAEEVSISGLRILVVDDEADARELIGLTLESRGAAIQLASSARDALLSISRSRPDVMIADIGMPQEDGYVLIQTLRALEREHSHTRLPAIALTAYASIADRDQALVAGYDLHLAKPVGPVDLTQALTRFRKTRQRDA